MLILPIEYGIWYCRERFSTFEHLWFVPNWFWSENWFLISDLHCILLWTHVELLFLNSNQYPKRNFVWPVWSGPPRTDLPDDPAGHWQKAIINDYAYSHYKCTRIQSKLPGIGNELLNKGWKTRRKMKKSPELIKKFNFWSDHPGTLIIWSDLNWFFFSKSSFTCIILKNQPFLLLKFHLECLLLLNVEGIEHHSTFLTIFMVFDYKEIYYYFRTSKYKQILTNKSHRHEILKSSYNQRIAVATYTHEILFLSLDDL